MGFTWNLFELLIITQQTSQPLPALKSSKISFLITNRTKHDQVILKQIKRLVIENFERNLSTIKLHESYFLLETDIWAFCFQHLHRKCIFQNNSLTFLKSRNLPSIFRYFYFLLKQKHVGNFLYTTYFIFLNDLFTS